MRSLSPSTLTSTVDCPYCERNDFKNWNGLTTHCARTHRIKSVQVIVDIFFDGKWPTCTLAGCSNKVTYLKCAKFARFCSQSCVSLNAWNSSENPEEYRKNRGKLIKAGQQSMTLEAKDEWRHNVSIGVSKTRREMFAAGELIVWNDKRINPNVKMWNSGSTKETDPRIAAYAVKGSASLKKYYETHHGWSNGLTEETDPRVKSMADAARAGLVGVIPWSKGLTKNDDERLENAARLRRLTELELDERLEQSNFERAFMFKDYEGFSNRLPVRCKSCGEIAELNIGSVVKGQRCPSCNPPFRSVWQTEIADFIGTITPNVKQCNRQVISPYEIDILCEDKRLGVECHGLYWHSSAVEGTDQNIHLTKFELARKSNLRLIQLFEDEWQEHEQIIESMIICAITSRDRINELVTRYITAVEAEAFWRASTLHAFPNDATFVGIYDATKLTTVVAISDRTTIIGYAAAMLNADTVRSLVLFLSRETLVFIADNRLDDIDAFVSAGFGIDKISAPRAMRTDYYERFADDENRVYRALIYDAGQTVLKYAA